MSDGVPIISLWQPWIWFVCAGWKTIETRTHNRFKSLEGKTIGLHAALKWDDEAFELASPYLSEKRQAVARTLQRSFGAVVCTAKVESFRELSIVDSGRALIDCGKVRRFGLFLEEVRMMMK